MKRIVVPAEFKAAGDKPGQFSGYASIFGNVDLGRDLIVKDNPFREIVTNAAGQVKVLFQHDAGHGMTGSGGQPIGLATVEQNSKGLKFEGALVMEDPFVQRVHAHMKAGSLDGMSIGYDILPGGAKINESGIRELSALKLWEISPVTFGMNPKASITDVKSVETAREIEDLLRDAVGLSRSEAKKFAGAILKTLAGQREAGGDAEEAAVAQRILALLDGVATLQSA
jgi:HK97 family phage prohead protease